jgi:hypothetical protein
MTEADWDRSTEPQKMLKAVRAGGRASKRKLRLFACACCRRIWHLLPDERSRRAVEVAERYADGRVKLQELLVAEQEARAAAHAIYAVTGDNYAALAATEAAAYTAPRAGCEAASFAESALHEKRSHEWAAQAGLLRCIFGNPFRLPPSAASAVLAWNEGLVPRLAQAAYQERAFDHLPVLADALEDAGCADADLLGHLRGPGQHVRGCWAVDLLLGKG